MAIEETAGGTIFTGSDIVRVQATTLNYAMATNSVNKSDYFRTMFTLYHNGKLQFSEIAELFAFATKYKKSANPIMNDDDKDIRKTMIDNGWFTNKGEWLVNIDEMIKGNE
jgi:hypothetical protein